MKMNFDWKGEIRVCQDGSRDMKMGEFRADESSGWIWESSHALETVLMAFSCHWETQRVLELGAGVKPLPSNSSDHT